MNENSTGAENYFSQNDIKKYHRLTEQEILDLVEQAQKQIERHISSDAEFSKYILNPLGFIALSTTANELYDNSLEILIHNMEIVFLLILVFFHVSGNRPIKMQDGSGVMTAVKLTCSAVVFLMLKVIPLFHFSIFRVISTHAASA